MKEKRKISLTLNKHQQEILNCLLVSGLHGRTLTEVVRRLMDRVKGKAKS